MNQLFEMSNFFVGIQNIRKEKQKDSNGKFYLALNGNNDYVRPPHFHIYNKDYKNWTIEINLQRFLCTGDLFIRRIKDEFGIDLNSKQIDQDRYEHVKRTLLKIISQKPNVSKPDYVATSQDCIEAMIRIFNKEADIVTNGSSAYKTIPEDEKLLIIMKESSDKMKILPQFKKYFSLELQKKYSECFQ